MIGTIVNTLCIIGGSIIGATLKKGIKPKYQVGLYDAMGLCALLVGINACVKNMPKSEYPVLFIIAVALGALIGFRANLSGGFDRLMKHFSSSKQNNLGEGLSSAILVRPSAIAYCRIYGCRCIFAIKKTNGKQQESVRSLFGRLGTL